MYGCETWTLKKAKCQRIAAFKLWCWRRLLRVPWTARRSNQSIIKEINPEYSLEEPMLKLKLQYFGHLMGRADSFEKTNTGRRRWHPTPVLLPGKSHGRKSLVGYSPWGRKESDTTEQLSFFPSSHIVGRRFTV